MDPSSGEKSTIDGRLPRTRGDGPEQAKIAEALEKASPHTRGWTRIDHGNGDGYGGFPAHAGMDLHAEWAYCRAAGASPHTRGWTLIRRLTR